MWAAVWRTNKTGSGNTNDSEPDPPSRGCDTGPTRGRGDDSNENTRGSSSRSTVLSVPRRGPGVEPRVRYCRLQTGLVLLGHDTFDWTEESEGTDGAPPGGPRPVWSGVRGVYASTCTYDGNEFIFTGGL